MGSKPSLLSSIDNLKRLFDSVPFRKCARLVYYSTLFEKGDDAYFSKQTLGSKQSFFRNLIHWFSFGTHFREESISPNLNLGRHKKYFSQIAGYELYSL